MLQLCSAFPILSLSKVQTSKYPITSGMFPDSRCHGSLRDKIIYRVVSATLKLHVGGRQIAMSLTYNTISVLESLLPRSCLEVSTGSPCQRAELGCLHKPSSTYSTLEIQLQSRYL